MKRKLGVSKTQANRIYRILKDHLGRKPESESLFRAFESDPEQFQQGLAEYLQSELAEDDALAEQIADALNGGDGAHFANVVTGGRVEQIVNIAKLGVLNLTLERKYFAFRDLRQLTLFLMTAVLIGGVLYVARWVTLQPAKMDGDFNIAVAQFGEVTGDGVESSAMATQLSNRLFHFLDSEFKAPSFDMVVQVTNRNIPIIEGDEEAQKLAEKTNAHLVVYGDLIVTDDTAELSPRFYVAEHPDTSELTRQQRLAAPISFDVSALNHSDQVNSILRSQASILFLFTEGLTFITAENYQAAERSLRAALDDSEEYGDYAGKEVLHLVLGTIMRLQGDYTLARKNFEQALVINPEYARAHIGLGNIYYLEFEAGANSDKELLQRAIDEYELALDAEDWPRGSFVDVKVDNALGNAYVVAAQLNNDVALFQLAIEHYGRVVSRFEDSGDENLRDLASASYFGLGAAFEGLGEYQQAQDMYQSGLDSILTSSELVERIEERLEIVNEQLVRGPRDKSADYLE